MENPAHVDDVEAVARKMVDEVSAALMASEIKIATPPPSPASAIKAKENGHDPGVSATGHIVSEKESDEALLKKGFEESSDAQKPDGTVDFTTKFNDDATVLKEELLPQQKLSSETDYFKENVVDINRGVMAENDLISVEPTSALLQSENLVAEPNQEDVAKCIVESEQSIKDAQIPVEIGFSQTRKVDTKEEQKNVHHSESEEEEEVNNGEEKKAVHLRYSIITNKAEKSVASLSDETAKAVDEKHQEAVDLSPSKPTQDDVVKVLREIAAVTSSGNEAHSDNKAEKEKEVVGLETEQVILMEKPVSTTLQDSTEEIHNVQSIPKEIETEVKELITTSESTNQDAIEKDEKSKEEVPNEKGLEPKKNLQDSTYSENFARETINFAANEQEATHIPASTVVKAFGDSEFHKTMPTLSDATAAPLIVSHQDKSDLWLSSTPSTIEPEMIKKEEEVVTVTNVKAFKPFSEVHEPVNRAPEIPGKKLEIHNSSLSKLQDSSTTQEVETLKEKPVYEVEKDENEDTKKPDILPKLPSAPASSGEGLEACIISPAKPENTTATQKVDIFKEKPVEKHKEDKVVDRKVPATLPKLSPVPGSLEKEAEAHTISPAKSENTSTTRKVDLFHEKPIEKLKEDKFDDRKELVTLPKLPPAPTSLEKEAEAHSISSAKFENTIITRKVDIIKEPADKPHEYKAGETKKLDTPSKLPPQHGVSGEEIFKRQFVKVTETEKKEPEGLLKKHLEEKEPETIKETIVAEKTKTDKQLEKQTNEKETEVAVNKPAPQTKKEEKEETKKVSEELNSELGKAEAAEAQQPVKRRCILL